MISGRGRFSKDDPPVICAPSAIASRGDNARYRRRGERTVFTEFIPTPPIAGSSGPGCREIENRTLSDTSRGAENSISGNLCGSRRVCRSLPASSLFRSLAASLPPPRVSPPAPLLLLSLSPSPLAATRSHPFSHPHEAKPLPRILPFLEYNLQTPLNARSRFKAPGTVEPFCTRV